MIQGPLYGFSSHRIIFDERFKPSLAEQTGRVQQEISASSASKPLKAYAETPPRPTPTSHSPPPRAHPNPEIPHAANSANFA